MTNKFHNSRLRAWLGAGMLTCVLASVLTACGGSSGGPGGSCVDIDPTRSGALPGCGGTAATPGTVTSSGLSLDLQDNNGGTSSNLMPDSPLTVKAVLKTSTGAAVPNAVINFTSTDTTAVFSPSSATAMTDAAGSASIKLSAGTQAGAFTLTATSAAGSAASKATRNYTVSFPTLTLSDMRLSPSTLPAGGNASVTISVLNNGAPYLQPVSIAFSSACVQAGKATIGSPVITQNGVATASYTDKGCNSSDTLTATVSLPNATLSKSAQLTVLPAATGSLKFISADPTNIALVGSGGVNRPESSILKFQVFDQNGSPVVGKQVNFTFGDSGTSNTTGGLHLSPSSATTAQDGTVITSVSGGTIPTSVRVIATAAGNSPILTTTSSLLVVSSGVPDQNHFTIAPTIGNCEGFDYNTTCTVLGVVVGDHFGNAVPDGTAVNFTTEGGVVEPSCLTKNGVCTVNLWSANPRPSNARVTVLAYVIGEESFTDSNGNNVYDLGEPYEEKSPDIYRDDDENGMWTAGEPCIGTNPAPLCNSPGDGQYNGVLRRPQIPSAQVLYVSRQIVLQFSGSHANIDIQPAAIACTSGTVDVRVTIKDDRGLWMPAGSNVSFATLYGGQAYATLPGSLKVNNVVLGIGEPANVPTYLVTVPCLPAKGTFVVTVTTPFNNTTIGKVNIN